MQSKESKIIDAAQKLFFRHGFKKVSMSDIAEAADLSRPSLYAAFANKEAVIMGLVKIHMDYNHLQTEEKLKNYKTVEDQLTCLFDIWIVKPYALAIDHESGQEMTSTISEYAPEGINQVYKSFEEHVIKVLKPKMKKKSDLSAKDLAHILSMASKGIKASSETVPELKRLVNGLITMTLTMTDK